MKISVSILGLKEKNKLLEIENSKPDYVHIDVMDGDFVSNKSFPIDEVNCLIDDYNYEVHLMVNDVKKYIDDFEKINPEIIIFHIEVDDTPQLIKYVKEKNIKVGLAINPNTEVEKLYPYLDLIDLVLIMSVEPGKGGQAFMMSSIDKIEKLYNHRKINNLNFKISVDGGVNNTNIKYLKKCDIIVSGSYITSGDYKNKIEILRGEL